MVTSGKCVLALGRSPVPLATHVRGTVIVSSQRSLESRGLLERYRTLLAPSAREALSLVVAPSWVPMELGLAHYQACERLELGVDVIDAIGRESGNFIYSATAATVLRLSTQFGSTPWAILTNLNRFSARTWDGGAGFAVYELAPKEAEVHWHGQPVAHIPYFRTAFGAFLAGCIGPFCRTAYHRVLKAPAGENTLAYRISWV